MELNIENLKCCGNCNHRESQNIEGENIESCYKNKLIPSCGFCDNWEFDDIDNKNRMFYQ